MTQPFDRLRATPPNHQATQPTRSVGGAATTRLPNFLAVALLLVLFALLVFSIQNKSPTLDEQNHIARGLAYLKTGDLRLSQEHPPLINAWQAWPLLLDPAIRLPLDSPSWANAEWYGFADQLLWGVNDGAVRERMVFAARVCTMGLTLLLAALVYRWGKALGGAWAGLLAMGVLVFDPNILAHGRLATTDMGITCLSVAAMYVLWNALRCDTSNSTPGRQDAGTQNKLVIPAQAGIHCPSFLSLKHWLLAGVILGLALVSKFSALVLGPVTLIAVLLACLGQKPGFSPKPGFWSWIARLVILYGVGFGAIWAVYGFEWGKIDLLGGLPGPAPSYWAGIQTILQRTGGGSTAFLMGQLSDRGWWYYFPVAFALKTPLPTLILLALALILAIKGQIAHYRSQIANCKWQIGLIPYSLRLASCVLRLAPYALLFVPPLAFWSMALTGGFNIGYRHILPSLPFLFILTASHIAPHADSRIQKKHGPVIVSVFAVYALMSATLNVAPNYLAFFNKLIGDIDNGYKFLVDSNLDWGQDLPALAQDYVDRAGEPIYLSWFGAAHPEAYGFDFHPLPGFWRFGGDPAAYGFNPFAPAPGWYAISASNLQGIKLADPDTYAWFRAQKPFYHVNHSILIYEVTGQTAPHSAYRAIVLAVPTAQLADAERALLAEGAGVRQFDPASGAIVPAADEVWYVLPELPGWGEAVREGPGYVVVRGTPSLHAAAPSAQFGRWVNLGYDQVESPALSTGKPLTVRIEWKVSEPPHRAATSFAHLLDAEGRYVAGWDGLTAPATCWQPGDVIAQTYVIPLPADLEPGTYQIEVGWYDAETVQRWPCLIDGQSVGDRFIIDAVEIKE